MTKVSIAFNSLVTYQTECILLFVVVVFSFLSNKGSNSGAKANAV
jgi:hypothetical protein